MAARTMTEVVSARYEFTDKERADLGRELAEIYQHKITLDEERKAAADQIKERSSALDLKSGSLSRMLTAGFEMRQIPCTLQWDAPNVGEVSYYRQDNGEFLKTRTMTVAERQLELPLEGGGPQLLEFPAQEKASVDASAAAISEFFDTADKANVPEERIEVIPPEKPQEEPSQEEAAAEPTLPVEPPATFNGSLEEYKAMLDAAAAKPPADNWPELPPMSPGKGSKKKK